MSGQVGGLGEAKGARSAENAETRKRQGGASLFSLASIFRRWNGERWLVVGTFMLLLGRRGAEGKRLSRIERTFARFDGSYKLGDWRSKPKPDGGGAHG